MQLLTDTVKDKIITNLKSMRIQCTTMPAMQLCNSKKKS